MRQPGWTMLDLALALAVLAVALVVVLHTRRPLWSSPVEEARAAVKDFAESGATEATVKIAGKTVTLRAVARGASAVPNPPRGRNVIELRGLPCRVAQDLDAKTDDGNFAKGNVRASVASCAAGGDNDPVPVVVVALPS